MTTNKYYLGYISTKNALYTPKGENPTTNEQDDKLYTHTRKNIINAHCQRET
jgi:hypothetical protein